MSFRVLVIDEDDTARLAICSLLRTAGFSAFELGSPLGVSSAIIRDQIEVVILELQMPTMSGDKLVRLLRANRRLAAVAIVLVSACSIPELAESAGRSRADAFVPKSKLRTALIEAVRSSYALRVRPEPAREYNRDQLDTDPAPSTTVPHARG